MSGDGLDSGSTDFADSCSESEDGESEDGEYMEFQYLSPPSASRTTTFASVIFRSGIIPRQLAMILLSLAASVHSPCFTCVEYFAGVQSITNGFRDLDLPAAAFDVLTVSEEHDILTTPGFLRALVYVLCLEDDGLLWCAPPCSSWIWIGRSTTGRSRDLPLGNERGKTAEANCLVARVVLVILVGLVVHNARVWMENPGSSIIEYHPRWAQLQALLGQLMDRVFIWMQTFGSEVSKPTLLYSTAERLQSMRRTRDSTKRQTVKTSWSWVDADGRNHVTGHKQIIKNTAAYPRSFGKHIAQHHVSHTQPMGPGISVQNLIRGPLSDDAWHDAKLPQVMSDMGLL